MDNLRRLEEIFGHFPGIGPRQARRFVYYLLGRSPSFIKEFTQLVEEVKKAAAECSQCYRFFVGKNSKNSPCPTCADPSRDQSTLMVVARDSDFETVERSGAYKGLYFILGGTIPILDKEPDKRVRLKGLFERVAHSEQLKEVILSLNATPDGEHTANIVRDGIRNIRPELKQSVLGRGLSTGAELEYVDSDTIKGALENRH